METGNKKTMKRLKRLKRNSAAQPADHDFDQQMDGLKEVDNGKTEGKDLEGGEQLMDKEGDYWENKENESETGNKTEEQGSRK